MYEPLAGKQAGRQATAAAVQVLVVAAQIRLRLGESKLPTTATSKPRIVAIAIFFKCRRRNLPRRFEILRSLSQWS